MTDWAAFAGIAVVVLFLLLVLARASQSYVGSTVTRAEATWLDRLGDGADHLDASGARSREGRPAGDADETMPAGLLLVNVALSQGLFGVVLVLGAWYTAVPLPALGLSADPLSTGVPALAWGVGLGVALSAANGLGGYLARRVGHRPSEDLRKLLAPDSFRGWVLLLGVALPTVAVFEELLFRAALVGAFAAGFGVSPWLLAVVSSVAFALGHGAQGPAGVVVTGLLGLVLAAAFVLTGSLVVVVVAHYLVNAAEFVWHEVLDVGTLFGPRA